MARYAGDAQTSELGRFDSTIKRMNEEENERYRTKVNLREEIKAFEEMERARRLQKVANTASKKTEPIRFAGWADPRVVKAAKKA